MPRSNLLSPLTLSLLSLCAITLGPALMGTNWFYSPTSLVWLSLSFLFGISALFTTRSHFQPSPRQVIFLLCAGLLLSWLFLFFHRPGSFGDAQWVWFGNTPATRIQHQRIPPLSQGGLLLHPHTAAIRSAAAQQYEILRDTATTPEEAFLWQNQIDKAAASLRATQFQMALVILAFFSLLALLPHRSASIVGLPLTLALFFMLGLWIIRSDPAPFIDVWIFQQQSAHALLHAQNPYTITFPNIYGQGIGVYGSALQSADRVNFGFPYTPLSLFLTLPGYIFKGDHRYSQLAALTLSAALIAYSRPGTVPKFAALLLLLSPRTFQVIELAWTEPFVILLLSLTIFSALRFPKFTPYALGLFLASKQYLLFALPLIPLLPIPRLLPFLLKTLLTTAAVSLPLALWNFPAFWHSAITLQFHQPLREDALSFLIFTYHNISKPLAQHLGLLPYVAIIPVIILSLRRFPKSPASFAAALALVYLTFYAFNRQAFCNYYYFVIGALCCAIAAMSPAQPAQQAKPAARSL